MPSRTGVASPLYARPARHDRRGRRAGQPRGPRTPRADGTPLRISVNAFHHRDRKPWGDSRATTARTLPIAADLATQAKQATLRDKHGNAPPQEPPLSSLTGERDDQLWVMQNERSMRVAASVGSTQLGRDWVYNDRFIESCQSGNCERSVILLHGDGGASPFHRQAVAMAARPPPCLRTHPAGGQRQPWRGASPAVVRRGQSTPNV